MGYQVVKESFTDIYTAPDPLRYLERMEALGYQVPHQAQPFFRATVDAVRDVLGSTQPPAVTDVGCSYGVNAALLNTDTSLADLYAHYGALRDAGTVGAELRSADRAHWWRLARPEGVARVHGVDSSSAALGYARAVGLLADGLDADLEAEPRLRVPAGVAGFPRDHVLVSTGAIGYVGARTLGTLVARMARPRVLVVFVLRSVDYDDCIALYRSEGLSTVRLPGLHPQRRFASAQEQDGTVAFLRGRGVETAGAEDDGHQYAECFLTAEDPELLEHLRSRLELLSVQEESA